MSTEASSTTPLDAPHAPSLAPVAAAQRLAPVDTLRGFALLGILAMNIIAFALPSAAYMNPMLPSLEPYQGPFTGLNRLAWWIAYLLFDTKMMTIFSMLFGAGLVLLGGRAETSAHPRALAGVYYHRLLWLFIIGMAHAYLVWYGDILVAYALCGLALYPARRLRASWLLPIGAALVLIAVPINAALGAGKMHTKEAARQAQQVVDSGGTPTPEQTAALESYRRMMEQMEPPAAQVARDVAAMRGSLPQMLRANAAGAFMLQGFIFAIWTLWRVLGLMLIGMGLMKLGVFAAQRSARFYTLLAVLGYGLGLPVVVAGGVLHIKHSFDPAWMFLLDWHFNYIGSVGVALGHVGVVMLFCRSSALPGLRAS